MTVVAPDASVLSFAAYDTQRWMTRFGLLGSAAGAVLAVFGVPRVDLHGPLHQVGIMDPLCGGTRAAFLLFHGDWAAAWTYNPIVFLLAAAGALVLLRAMVGMLSGRWVTVRINRRRMLVVLLVIAAAALEVHQQLHAELLMTAWPT